MLSVGLGVSVLRQFQEEGVRGIYQFRGRALLGDDQGLGKTIQALAWLTRIPNRRPAVVIAPASVKYVWQSEAQLHFGLRTEVIEGRYKGRVKRFEDGIIILNYDILKSWLPVLLRSNIQALIIDEIHFIKSFTAQRTKAVLRLSRDVSSVVGLSGTPLTNRPIELWTVLQAIRPDIFPSREKFAWSFCKPRYTPWGWQYDGAANLGKLNRILRRECLIRRLKKDVLPELPDKSRRAVPFKLKSYDEYHKAQTQFIAWLKELSPVRAKRAKKAEALSKIGYLIRLAAKLKLPWTEKWIAEFLEANPGQKLVCFTMHTFVIEHLAERFRGRCVVVDGSVTGRLRHEAVRKFQNNRRVDLFFGNWKAAGVGITLTASSNCAALDLPWTPGDLLQGEDRIHRIGQKMKAVIHYLMTLGTIEEKQITVLRKKSKILDAVLDGRADAKDFSIFDELLDSMRHEK